MQLHLYQIDAFADKIFEGNPACVVPLSNWLPDELLLKIARENAVAETAFIVDLGYCFHLRWFTPEKEMDLCGHATLAAAHAIKEIRKHNANKILFETLSGDLEVVVENGVYTLNFPTRKAEPTHLPELLKDSLNIQPQEILKARDYVLVYPREEDVKNIQINRVHFDKLELDTGGVIITAPGKDTNVDFISRFFTPGALVFEDPVTGSAHCSLIPYWSERLEKSELNARQISPRGGNLKCTLKEDRVAISGRAKTYFIGKLFIE